MDDQDGMHRIGAAVTALAADPYPPEAFHRGDYHRLRAGRFRVVYVIDGDLITVERVDIRVA
jgi:mRNA-degrading endonuclease RelE of RelBE toxin-antitoxin system